MNAVFTNILSENMAGRFAAQKYTTLDVDENSEKQTLLRQGIEMFLEN